MQEHRSKSLSFLISWFLWVPLILYADECLNTEDLVFSLILLSSSLSITEIVIIGAKSFPEQGWSIEIIDPTQDDDS